MSEFIARSTFWRAPLFGILLAGAFAMDLPAQGRADALEKIDLGLSLNYNMNRETIHRYWDVLPGVTGYMQLPFYRGRLHMDVHANRYLAHGTEQPDFTAVFILLGWGKKLKLAPYFVVSGSAHAGMYQMVFDEISGPMKWEGEIAFGLRARAEIPAGDRLRFGLSATYLSVRTARPLDLAFVSFGLSYRLTTPAWLLNFLE